MRASAEEDNTAAKRLGDAANGDATGNGVVVALGLRVCARGASCTLAGLVDMR